MAPRPRQWHPSSRRVSNILAPHAPPAAAPGGCAWQKRWSGITHIALYAVLVLMPLTGWASASARNWPIHAFGLIPLPALVSYRAKIGFRLGDVHADVLYWILLGLITLHVGAALYHRFARRDDVLSRMLPGV
jgi:cytochrome b561